VALSVSGPDLLAQLGEDWWVVYDRAVKTISSGKAVTSDLEAARLRLRRVIEGASGEAKTKGEGKVATFNISNRIDYLPYFYLGWASYQLQDYPEAQTNLKKSQQIGYVKEVPDLNRKLQQFLSLVEILGPARESRDAAATVGRKCMDAPQKYSAGARLQAEWKKLDGFLKTPPAAAADLENAKKAVDDLLDQCKADLGDEIIAFLVEDYERARADVDVAGLDGFLGDEDQGLRERARKLADDGKKQKAEKPLSEAAKILRELQARAGAQVDAARDAALERARALLAGNVEALDEEKQRGSSLSRAVERAAPLRASGKKGKDLETVIQAAADLRAQLAEAEKALPGVKDRYRRALEGAKSDFDAWAQVQRCGIGAVQQDASVTSATQEAAAALPGTSADAMKRAVAKLASVKESVGAQIKDALPRMKQDATNVLALADRVLPKLREPDLGRANQFKDAVTRAVGKDDICEGPRAISQLGALLRERDKEFAADLSRALERTAPVLAEAQSLLGQFGGILKKETAGPLRSAADQLAGLRESKLDPAAIEKAGEDVRSRLPGARSEISGQILAGVQRIDQWRRDAAWQNVSAFRRDWIERNLAAVRGAAGTMSDPALLLRFARDYPRAELQMALARAFSALYEKGDPAAAAEALKDLGPDQQASATFNFAIAYFRWWQANQAPPDQRDALWAEAKRHFEAGRKLQASALLGPPLFAPGFEKEMLGQSSSSGGF
jgi:hypothetical protein